MNSVLSIYFIFSGNSFLRRSFAPMTWPACRRRRRRVRAPWRVRRTRSCRRRRRRPRRRPSNSPTKTGRHSAAMKTRRQRRSRSWRRRTDFTRESVESQATMTTCRTLKVSQGKVYRQVVALTATHLPIMTSWVWILSNSGLYTPSKRKYSNIKRS